MIGGGARGADVLVVSPQVPEFDRAAGCLRLYLLLQVMAQKYRVKFLGRLDLAGPESQRYVGALQDLGIDVYPAPQVDVADLAEDVKICAFFEFYSTAEPALARLRARRPDLPVIVDTVDVHFVREIRALEYSRRSWPARLRAARRKKRELDVYGKADLVLAVTETDRAEILRGCPKARVAVLPSMHPMHDTVPGFHARRRNSLLFVGGFAHSPNVDAVLFFCRDVLPLIEQALPDVEVTIVGHNPSKELQDLARQGVIIAGWVPELAPLLDSHCVSIAPLRFGAGIKGKIGEAMAAGLPVVTTTVGAEGMDLEHGNTAMIADAPAAFAEAVVRLCTDATLHQTLSASGQRHALRHWGVGSVSQQLIEIIEGLGALRPRSLRTTELLAARASDAYVRSGLRRKIARVESVATWYGGQVLRRFGRR
jgi:glycosyltransferase involved in cell wall biosynthesis